MGISSFRTVGHAPTAAAQLPKQPGPRHVFRTHPTMKTFTLLQHPDGRREAIAQGICLPALLTPPAWMAIQRLWLAMIVWLGAAAALVYAYFELAHHQNGLQTIHMALAVGAAALFVMPGVLGNSWLVSRLLDQGFEPERSVQAESAEAAKTMEAD